MASVMKRCLECPSMVTLRDPIGPRMRCQPCQLIFENKTIKRARQAKEAEDVRRAAERSEQVQAHRRAPSAAGVPERKEDGGAALRPPPSPKGRKSPSWTKGG